MTSALHEKTIYIPKKYSLYQSVEISKKWLKNNPEKLHEEAYLLILLSLSEAAK